VDTSQLQAHDGDGIRDFVDRNFGETGVSFRPGWDLSGEHADLAVATSWATAETVASSAVDAKAYFVQDFENLFFAPGEDAIRAERTYHLGLSCVTLGEWLTAELRSRYGADSTAFPFPVTVEEPGGDLSSGSRDGGPRLLFFAQPDKPRRGYRLGLEALAIFHEACPEVKIAFFGSKDVDRESVPVPFEDHGILSESQLEELYRGADAGFVISMTNPTLVSANMMRCGCVPVDLDLPNNRFEYRSEEDSLLAEPTAAGIAEALRRLFTDRKLLERLRAAGPISVEGRSLETCVDAIEAAFVRKLLTGETAERPFQLEVFQGEPTTWVSLADGPVAQAIRGRTDGLTRISLMLGTFDQLPGALDVELVDSRTGEIVVQQCMVGEGVRNNDWNHVDFEPIADSGGRDFDLRLRMSEADAAPVAVYLSGAGARLDAAARSGDSALAAPICFETYVRPIGAAPAVPIARQSEPAHRRAASTPVAAGELSEQAAHIVELIWTRGAQERELRSVLEERTAALEHGTAGLTAFLNGIEGRITRPPFDRLLRLVGLAPPRETYHEPMRFVTVDLRGDVVVAQRFVAERDGLDRLMVRVATEGRRLQAPLVLRLREGGLRGPVVREVEIPPSQVYDNQHCTAAFEALADSAGQIYCFELSSPSALRGCAPRIWGHRSRDGSGQRRYHRGARAGGRLDFLQGFGSILGG
jgi:glycosyltransferase involved in cell wall biosynthesis